ncbi:MAG: 5-(carboxyamino)imidazole ribonucleotide synthase [Frankiales bacterium]|nr:5-(carboxyamino)imidazole ribonucleotide synthase [Frankiales bacterium]
MTDPITGLPVVGIVGGGQLARMTQQAAIALGVRLRVLSDTADDSAALVSPFTTVGNYRSYEDLAAFAVGCDVITFDHEHVPLEHLQRLATSGVTVRPGPAALPFVQDKIRMRERLGAFGVPIPAWTVVARAADLPTFGDEQGWPVVVKTASGGYDGKGVWFPASADEAIALFERIAAGGRVYVEERVDFDRELSAMVARSATGELRVWPVVETVQTGGVCTEVLAPAPSLDPRLAVEAQTIAKSVAEDLGVVGVMAVELFEVDGRLLVNELAMRPHNSGHWTIEGARTSQFEQHLRAVLGWPLGETTLAGEATAMANALGGAGPEADNLACRLPQVLAMDPGAHVHLYGKSVRPGRKIGHVTVVGDDIAENRRRARAAADLLQGEPL